MHTLFLVAAYFCFDPGRIAAVKRVHMSVALLCMHGCGAECLHMINRCLSDVSAHLVHDIDLGVCLPAAVRLCFIMGRVRLQSVESSHLSPVKKQMVLWHSASAVPSIHSLARQGCIMVAGLRHSHVTRSRPGEKYIEK